jgi:hypothetical protein
MVRHDGAWHRRADPERHDLDASVCDDAFRDAALAGDTTHLQAALGGRGRAC